MSRALPPLGWFRAFEAAARRLSFTHAADELGLTQSAVSQQIRALETRLGCALFERKHRAVALTDEGRRLLPEVAVSIAGLRSIVDAFDAPERVTVLTVATSVSVAQWAIAPRLARLLDAERDLRVRLVTAVWPDHVGTVPADVRIRFGARSEDEPAARLLGSTALALFAAPSVLGSADVHLSDAELGSHRLIRALGTADAWSRHAAELGYAAERHADVHVDSHGLALDLARCGVGVAFTSEWLAQSLLRDGALVRAHPASIEGRDGYWVSVSPGRRSAAAERFVAWLLDDAADTLPPARPGR